MLVMSGVELAKRFADVSGAFLATVEGLDEADLARTTAEEQWTIGALAGHVATVIGVQSDWVEMVLAGTPLPQVTMDDIHHGNAEQAAHNARIGKDELLTWLRTNRERMLGVLQGLNEGDAEERTAVFSLFDGADVSIRTIVELGLIEHIGEHLASLRAAVSAPAG
jgi:hypothetical protein